MHIILFSLPFIFTLFIACSVSESTETEMTTTALSSIEAITDKDLDIASNINNNFTFDIYHHMGSGDKNTFLSGYSLFSMLNMLLGGAAGETQEEMLKSGNIDMPLAEWERSFSTLNAETMRFLYTNNSGYKFSFANSFWVQEGRSISTAYSDKLKNMYGIDVRTVDFEGSSTQAREQINSWASEMTEGLIPDILDKDSVDENSEIVMVNAMYLKALWRKSFYHDDTKMRDFSLLGGDMVSVPMMHQVNKFRYVEKEGNKVVCMHYKDSDFGLVSFMPKEGAFEAFESNISNEVLDYFASDFELTKLDLYYPKFVIESEVSNLKEMLIDKGMVSAFNQNADFSNMGENIQLHISKIAQKIYFKIDEEGTEMASSTAISIGETDAQKALEVRFNRPFIVMICHIPTRTVLFMGKVMNPLD